jgi:hypothetical protein
MLQVVDRLRTMVDGATGASSIDGWRTNDVQQRNAGRSVMA